VVLVDGVLTWRSNHTIESLSLDLMVVLLTDNLIPATSKTFVLLRLANHRIMEDTRLDFCENVLKTYVRRVRDQLRLKAFTELK